MVTAVVLGKSLLSGNSQPHEVLQSLAICDRISPERISEGLRAQRKPLT